MNKDVDRRQFLTRAGLVGAAGAAAWVAPAITGANTAFAGTSCVYQVDESALAGWTHSGSGSSSVLSKSYAAVNEKPALTVQFAANSWNSGRTDADNVSVQSGALSYGGTNPHILVKGTPNSGVKGSNGNQGWIEVVMTFSSGVTNLTFDIQGISGWGALGVYRRWEVWMSGAANATPPPTFTFTRNDSTTTGNGVSSSMWTRDDRSYGAVSVSMVGSNANPITYVKFHFDMWRGWADSAPAAMDAGIANLRFCR